jgi:hypothetical protein
MSLKKNQIQKENQILKSHSKKIKAVSKKTKIKTKGKASTDSEKLLSKIQPCASNPLWKSDVIRSDCSLPRHETFCPHGGLGHERC